MANDEPELTPDEERWERTFRAREQGLIKRFPKIPYIVGGMPGMRSLENHRIKLVQDGDRWMRIIHPRDRPFGMTPEEQAETTRRSKWFFDDLRARDIPIPPLWDPSGPPDVDGTSEGRGLTD